MLGGADNPNGELPSYITGADKLRWLVQVQSMSFPGVTGMAGRILQIQKT